MDDLLLSGNTWEVKNNGDTPDEEGCTCKKSMG
jgi:hypothetical protein